jgi:hypothetical protein
MRGKRGRTDHNNRETLFFKQSGDAFRLPQGLVELGGHGSLVL